MCGFIAQLVEHRTGIAEVMGSNPVEALIFFFRLLLSNCLNWKIYCDDHTSLSYNTHLVFEKQVQLVSLCSWLEVYKVNQLKSFKKTELITQLLICQRKEQNMNFFFIACT